MNVNIDGLIEADSLGDGYSIKLIWAQAYPIIRSNKIGYNIYMSSDIAPTFPTDFFNHSPVFVSIDGSTSVVIVDLIPGQMYHFAVRAFEYNPLTFNPSVLPAAYSGLVTLPQSLLRINIGISDAIIPLVDVEQFPNNGTVKIGSELINYTSVDRPNNDLLLSNPSLQRGFNGTVPEPHRTDGYDGYVFWDPNVIFWPVENEEQNTRVFQCWNRFDIDHYAFTMVDGYRQRLKDILTTDLSGSDATNLNFPAYDFSGYHRTDPVLLLNGTCVGSYLGGQMFCADGYNGVGQMLRGLSAQDQNLQRQEVLLSTTGEPCVLIRRQRTGITCNCMLPYNEYPQNRCKLCYGTGFVVGWIEFFYNRRSDGRIMVRFDPAVDDLLATDSGLESDMKPTCWVSGDISVKDRDMLVRFEPDEVNEEFRYEILNVTRNRLLLAQSGVQQFAVQRVRKTDPIYQIPLFLDSSMFPRTITTSIDGNVGIPPHSHTLVVSEKILSISQINQITSIDAGHSHTVRGGIVNSENLHTHTIIFP